MKNKALLFILTQILTLTAVNPVVQANEFPVQARLFAGSTAINPSNLNQELANQNIKDFKSIANYGVEITYPVLKFLDAGMRYTKRSAFQDEVNSSSNTSYEATLSQDSILLLTRAPLLKTDIVRLDAFVGVGGSNTTLTLKTATQDGELSKRETNDWLASPYASYGASLAIGYRQFYFIIEAGYETNKVDSFKRSGNINNNIQNIDLSGGYASIGLLFDGITAKSK